MSDVFDKQMPKIKPAIADLCAEFVDFGFSQPVIMAALGSVLGNLIGLNVPEEEIDTTIERMIGPIKADAMIAVGMREAIRKAASH